MRENNRTFSSATDACPASASSNCRSVSESSRANPPGKDAQKLPSLPVSPQAQPLANRAPRPVRARTMSEQLPNAGQPPEPSPALPRRSAKLFCVVASHRCAGPLSRSDRPIRFARHSAALRSRPEHFGSARGQSSGKFRRPSDGFSSSVVAENCASRLSREPSRRAGYFPSSFQCTHGGLGACALSVA